MMKIHTKPLQSWAGDGKTLREWLKNNKHIKIVTRDRASANAKAIAEELPDARQIADRFHLHQNLLEAITKTIGREMSATIVIPKEKPEPEKLSTKKPAKGKKTSPIVDNISGAEEKRLQLIRQI